MSRPQCIPCDKSDVIDQTASDVKEMKDALLGDKYRKGYLEKVDRNRTRITRIERLIYIGTGAGMVVIFLIKFVF